MQSENFNVAWFKLAELVARKEKERALAIHRLLCHALESAALISQLEGDLLLAFNDEKAFGAYSKAGELFEQEGKLEEAATLYDRCKKLDHDNRGPYIRALIRIYDSLEDIPKLLASLQELAHLLAHQEPQFFLSYVHQTKLNISDKTTILLYFIEQVVPLTKNFESYIEEIIVYLITKNKDHSEILEKLKTISDSAYSYAIKGIEQYQQK